ncbi:MAG: branched-chain amino acid transaminase [Anaerolineaceae bacterium]|nr:branched-chain amino acid transaminase [Anaerolineaceae bacterium]
MPQFAFFEGKIVPLEQAKISIMTHAFNYGTACFEGIRAYWNTEEKQLLVFRLPEHYERLRQSTHIMMIDLKYNVEELCGLTVKLLRKEAYQEDTYIRPIAYKSGFKVEVKLSDLEDDFTIYTVPFGRYIEKEEGADVTISSWRRIDDNAMPPRGKITGVYASSALSKTEAVMNGFDEAIVLNNDGHVSEGSAENIFIVRDGKLITPPVTENILEGVTRSTVMQITREMLGLQTIERPIDRTELYVADEAFFCGTGVQVAAITSVDRRPVGDGKMGLVVSKIRELYFDIVRGRVQRYRHWCTPVGKDK